MYLTALKGHSKPGRETVTALSVSLSCNSVTSWAVHRDEGSMFMSNTGPWSRLLHSQVLPLLTASPPPPPSSPCLEDGGHYTLTKTEVWGSGYGCWGILEVQWLQRHRGKFWTAWTLTSSVREVICSLKCLQSVWSCNMFMLRIYVYLQWNQSMWKSFNHFIQSESRIEIHKFLVLSLEQRLQ